MNRSLTTYLIKLNGAMRKRCETYAFYHRERELVAYLSALADAGVILPDGVDLLKKYFETKTKSYEIQ